MAKVLEKTGNLVDVAFAVADTAHGAAVRVR